MNGSDDASRIDRMVEQLGAIAQDTNVDELPLSGDNGALDGLAMAINMLVDDLRHTESEGRALERRLRLSEERFRVIVDNSQPVIFIIDADWKFQLSEGASLATLGLTPGQVVGQSALEIYADFPQIIAGIRAAFAGDIFTDEIDIGGAHFDIFYSPYRDSDDEVVGVLGMAVDITERVTLAAERDRLEEQYRHAQKMEAVGRLAGGVAHDFNNVLCAITGNTDLALADLALTDSDSEESVRDALQEINKAAGRAADLTRQLLAYSRKQVIDPKVIDLSRLIEGLHRMLIRLIGEDVILRTVPQKQLGRVRVDPGQIEQVVLNLAINARDAMPDGGELVIETADVLLDDEYCEKHASATAGSYVMLGVSDTGCGMSAEVREKIFEPFYTTKELGQGTGLGLATVFGIVEQSGGRIEVYSEPGRGSSFKVYFPRLSEVTDIPERPAAPASAPSGGPETVLVVEDEEMVRRMAVRLLRRHGYRVLEASSGPEALELAERHDGTIDLLLTDVVMPRMNGRELAEALAVRRPGLKVLYTSGYTQNIIAQQGVLDEGLQFVSKPYAVATILIRIREVLDDTGA